jgi:hypothetical protein
MRYFTLEYPPPPPKKACRTHNSIFNACITYMDKGRLSHLPYVQSVFHMPLLVENLNERINLLCSWSLKIFRYLSNLGCENQQTLVSQGNITFSCYLRVVSNGNNFVKFIATCSWNSQLCTVIILRDLHFKYFKNTYNYYYESLAFWLCDRFIHFFST